MRDQLLYFVRLLPSAENTIYDSPFTIKPPTQVPFELVRQSYSPTNPKKVCVRGFPFIELITSREP